MADHDVWSKSRDMLVGVAEVDSDNGDSGGFGRINVGAGIAHHNRVGPMTAGHFDGHEQHARIRLGNIAAIVLERVLTADRFEAVIDFECLQQLFQLCQ